MKKLSYIFVLALAGCHAATTTNGIPTSGRANPDVPTVVVRDIHDKSDGFSIDVSFGDGIMYVDAISPRGIGGTKLILKSGTWPKKAVVRLCYAKDSPFGILEGAGAALEQTGLNVNEQRIYLTCTQRTVKTNTFEVNIIPGIDMKVLCIDWVDAYRR